MNTIDCLALGQVAVVLLGEEGVAVATDDAFDVAVVDIVEPAARMSLLLSGRLSRFTYMPSMLGDYLR